MNKSVFLILSCIVAQRSINAMETYPLHYAVGVCDISYVKDLLSSGANVNQRDGYGNSPLHFAVGSDSVVFDRSGFPIYGSKYIQPRGAELRIAIAQELIKAGACLELENENRMTPLKSAQRRHDQEMVELLTDYRRRMEVAQQLAQQVAQQEMPEILSVIEMALFDQSDNNHSPFAILPGDLCLLKEIVELSRAAILPRQAILQEAREPRQQVPTTNSWCIIS